MLLLFKFIRCVPEIQGYLLSSGYVTNTSLRSHMLFIYSICNKKPSPKYDIKHPLAGLSFNLGHGRLV